MKNKFLKLFALLFATLLLFTLFSCGGKKYDDTLDKDPFVEFSKTVENMKKTVLNSSNEENVSIASLLSGLDFSLEDFRTDGEVDEEMESVIMKDRTLFIYVADSSEDNNSAIKLYDSALVIYELMDDKTTASRIPLKLDLMDVDALTSIADVFDALALSEDDLTESEDDEFEFWLNDDCTERIADAFKDAEIDDVAQFFEDAKILVDISDYAKHGRIKFSERGDTDIELSVTIEKNLGTHTVSLSFENGDDDSEIDVEIKTKDSALVGFSVSGEAKAMNLTYNLSVQEEKSDIKKHTKYTFVADAEISMDTEKISFGLEASIYENQKGVLSVLDAKANVNKGEEEILSLGVKYDARLMQNKGEIPLSASLSYGKIDLGGINGGVVPLASSGGDGKSSLELALKTQEYSSSSSKYLLEIKINDEEENSTNTAILNIPSTKEPTLTEAEKKIIADGDKLYGSAEILEYAESLNQQAINALNKGLFNPSTVGNHVYTYNKDLDTYYFTDVELVNNQYYVTTRAVADYEKYLPLYSKNVSGFIYIEKSPVLHKLKEIVDKIENPIGNADGFFEQGREYFSYIYLEEYGFYAVMKYTNTNYVSYLTEEPTADIYYDYCIHEISKTENGYSLHDYSKEVWSDCTVRHVCDGCGCYFSPMEKEHDYTEAERTSGAELENGKLLMCERCGVKALEITDSCGGVATVLLSRLSDVGQSVVNHAESCIGYNVENPSKSLFISKISYKAGSEIPQSLAIPQIEDVYGYKIIGAATECAYGFSEGIAKLVLPEGLELIAPRAFFACFVQEVVMPDSLLYIGEDAFQKDFIREIVIPKGVLYIDSTVFFDMSMLTKITVNAEQLEELPTIDAKNLEELKINGTVKWFYGFSDCKITEFEVPEGVEYVYFSRNNNLKKLVLSSTVKEIVADTLSMNDTLEELVLNDGLEKISGYSFSFCTNLKSVVFPTSLKELSNEAFAGCEFTSVLFKGDYTFGELSSFAADEITYCGAIKSQITFGKVTNIYATSLPNSNGVVYNVPKSCREINFAGTESEFLAAGYLLSSEETVVNYNVKFSEE